MKKKSFHRLQQGVVIKKTAKGLKVDVVDKDGKRKRLPKIISRAQAKKRNLPRYFTNKPCKEGHVAELVTANGQCVTCALQMGQRYRDKAKDIGLSNNLESPPVTVLSRDEAIQQRVRFFFTGKKCRNKHLSQRYTRTGGCVECIRIQNRNLNQIDVVYDDSVVGVNP